MKITHHTDLLNALIEKHGMKSYLEIGVQNPANNFDKIKCEDKQGVDPELTGFEKILNKTSDFFFEIMDSARKYDLVFIDGLHHADQVKRDFENSLRCLSDNGFIVIHDCLPQNEKGTSVPRETVVWWGDVYKFCMSIRNHYHDIGFVTYNIDNGCMVVWKEPNKSYTTWNEAPFNWETYQKYGKILLNVVDEVVI